MTSCLYASCRLDDINSRWLTLWRQELQAIEKAVFVALASIEGTLSLLTSSTKQAATATFYGTSNNRCIFTWKTLGLDGNNWSISLLANMAYSGANELQRLITPNVGDTLTVSSHVVHAVNANLTSADVGRLLTISRSTSVPSNNGTYTVLQVNNSADLVTVEAFSGDDEHFLSGTGNSLTLIDAGTGTMLLDDLVNFPEGLSPANEVTISGASNGANNGTFLIVEVISGIGLFYTNLSGVTENPFGGNWEIVCPLFNGTSDGLYDRYSSITADVDEVARVITIKLSVLLSGASAGTAITGPKALADWVNAYPAISSYVVASAPDYDPGVGTDPPLIYGSEQLSGGHNASLSTMDSAMNKAFAKTQGYDNALRIAGLPGGESGSLSEVLGIIILSSGRSYTTENTTNLQAVWELLDALGGVGNEPILVSLLSQNTGPLVLWIRESTETINLDPCSGGGAQTTTMYTLECYNKKPAKNSMAVPWVWWLTRLQSTSEHLYTLKKYGLSRTQIENALNASYARTYLIEDPTILLGDVTILDIKELHTANVAGIEPLSYVGALNALSSAKASATTGFLSPILNLLPPATLKDGLNEVDATGVSQTVAMANEVLNSSCIDPAAKSGLIGIISAIDAGLSAFSYLVRALVRIIRIPINKAAKIAETLLAFFDGINDNVTCLDLSFDLALNTDIELIKLELPAFTTEVNSVLDSVVSALDEIMPSACKLKKAIHELIFTGSEELDCLAKGLTNDLVNFAGVNLKKLLPCITNPLDYLGLILQLTAKLDAEIAIVNGLIRDLFVLSGTLNKLVNWQDDVAAKEATSSCSSSALGGMVKHVKSILGA